jgi:NAD(P)-dependent dehydrogenase (short-subunit alcohol dehydrogenase family)
VQGDITSKDSLSSIAKQVETEVGFVNVVIANSGVTGPETTHLLTGPKLTVSELQATLWEPSMEFFTSTFNSNTTAMFYTLVAFMNLLDAGNTHSESVTSYNGVKSQFIVTSSISAFARRPGMGYAYSGSKMAAIQLAKQLSTTLGSYQIRVNSFAPGIYPSDMSSVCILCYLFFQA